MIIASSYDLKNKVFDNVPIPRTNKYTCHRVTMDERLSWEKHIDSICCKEVRLVSALVR